MTKRSSKWAPRSARLTQINCGEVKREGEGKLKSFGGEVGKQGEEGGRFWITKFAATLSIHQRGLHYIYNL